MELLQLKYFQVTARLENMTRAAEELHIAQPSLSKTISRLEEDLGVPLFDRQGKRIRLNRFGKVFLERAERSLRELEEGHRQLKDLAGADRGSVVVGAATARLLPNLVRDYLTGNPSVRFRLLQMAQKEELEQKLLDGTIDFSISSLPAEHLELRCEPLLVEEIFLAAPSDHRLAGRKSVKLSELAEEPLIYYTTESGLREIMNRFCRQAAFEPNIAFECTTPEVICSLVEAGLGLAFLPDYLWSSVAPESLTKLRLREPACKRTIWLSWVKDRYQSEAAADFRDFVIRYFARDPEDMV